MSKTIQTDLCARCKNKLGLRKHESPVECGYIGKLCHKCYKFIDTNTKIYEAECVYDFPNIDAGTKGFFGLQNFDERNIVFSTKLDRAVLVIPLKNIKNVQLVEQKEKSTTKKIVTLGFADKTTLSLLQIDFVDNSSQNQRVTFKIKNVDEVYNDLNFLRSKTQQNSTENNQISESNYEKPELETKVYGKILLETQSGLYYGGHKAYLAGGTFSEFQSGALILTTKYFIFIKSAMRESKRWKIVIPLESVDISQWHIEEKSRRKTIAGGGIPVFFGVFGGGVIDESGKKHNIVIPYIDENGIPQAPRFGVSSFLGGGIKKWAQALYEQVIEVQKDKIKTPQNNNQETKETKTEDPFHVLKLRLAKGEISKKEYEELRKLIE